MNNVHISEVFWTYRLNSAPVYNSGHIMCKRSVNNVISKVVKTYLLNSAPVHSSGHIIHKRKVSWNNVIGEEF